MSVELNELQDSVRQVIDAVGVAAKEEILWPQIVELGWLLVAVPEAAGGLDTGIQGSSAMHLELGRGLSAAPYLPAMLAIDALCESTVADRDSWLERVTTGEFVTAPLGESRIQLSGDVLSGTALAVQSADTATHVLLWSLARDVVALIALDQAGVERIARTTWDHTRRLFDVKLNNVQLANQIVLARGSQAAGLATRLLVQRDFAMAADAIGGADALLKQTVEYLQTRVQFKRPLAMFQALKHRCADLKAATVAADAMLSDAVRRVEGNLNGAEAELKAKGAKLLATTTFARVAEESLQLHGGIGMADEHPCHLYLKRALLSEQLGRANETYAADIAAGLLASVG
jgi:alkylation response protein AidB-like acyl-CoA dehydrogenase